MVNAIFSIDKNVVPVGKSFTIEIDGENVTITCLKAISDNVEESSIGLKRKRTPRDVVDRQIDTGKNKPFTRAELYE